MIALKVETEEVQETEAKDEKAQAIKIISNKLKEIKKSTRCKRNSEEEKERYEEGLTNWKVWYEISFEK